MGRKLRRVLSVVAAIAIPFVAPVIATSIGLSSAIGAAAANTVTGAVLGAGAAKLGGGDPLIGAITGGAGGYFGGGGGDLFAGPTSTPAPVAGPAGYGSFTTGADTGFTYYGGGTPLDTSGALTPFTPTAVAGQATGLDAFISPTGAPPISVPTTTPLDVGASLSATPIAPSAPAPAPAPDIGSQLSGYGNMGDISQGISYYGDTSIPAGTASTAAGVAGYPAGYTYYGPSEVSPPPGTIAPTTPASAQVTGLDLYTAPSEYTYYGSPTPTPPPGTIAPTTPVATPGVVTGLDAYVNPPSTFTEALKKVPGEIAAKFTDPKALANLTLQAAGLLAGSALAGDGMTPEERQLLEAERADLERLRSENEDLFRERLQAAQNLLGESRYFDPEYFGLQSARRSQLAGARSRKAGLRGLRGRQRDVAARQFELETARTTGTAFDVGSQTGLTGRLQTQQAGLSMMPTSFPSVSYAGLRGAYDTAAQRRSQQQGDIGRLFGALTS